MRITQIIISPTEPTATNLMWARLIGDKMTFYLYFNGRWRPVHLVNDQGTPTPEDDSIAEISDIGQTVQEEVSRQIQEHDVGVNDVHFALQPTDGKEYPNVMIFGSGD